MIRAIALTALLWPGLAAGQVVVATRTVPSQSILAPQDLAMSEAEVPGAVRRIEDAVGLEAAVTLFAGRPVHARDLSRPAAVDRNQIVVLQYRRATLTIETDGRALDRAAVGARVRVMNLSSRTIVVGEVVEDGKVKVGR